MKFIYFLAASMLIFVSCEKEETTDNTPSFSWKIDGDDYTDNSPVIDISPLDVLEIKASDNSVDITLIIYNFLALSDGSEISFLNPVTTIIEISITAIESAIAKIAIPKIGLV